MLTFCSDYDYTHASEYMKEKKYSFPVIADWALIKKVLLGGADQPSRSLIKTRGYRIRLVHGASDVYSTKLNATLPGD